MFFILMLIGISFFIYKFNEIKQRDFIFEKNKECISYKNKMYEQFLEEHDNFKSKELNEGWFHRKTEFINQKINKIFYNKTFNSCLFEVKYTLKVIRYDNNGYILATTFDEIIEIYDYLLNKKVFNFDIRCSAYDEKWKSISDNEMNILCGDEDKRDYWAKSYYDWQKYYN